MKKLLWHIVFWLAWPLVWFYSPMRARARALVVCGDEFLVVKPYFGSGHWQLPGGGIKYNESPVYAAAREVREEAGISIEAKSLKPLLTSQSFLENGLRKRYVIFSTVIKSKAAKHIKDHEIVDLAWLPLDGPFDGCAPHVVTALRHYTTTEI